MYRRSVTIIATVAFAFGFGIPRTNAQKMYWTVTGTGEIAPGVGDGKIQRANLDGSSVEDLLTGLLFPRAITVDRAGGKVYWTEGADDVEDADPSGRKIRRANLDGTGLEDVITSGFPQFLGFFFPRLDALAVDTTGGKIYWSAGQIQRANLDGSGIEEIIAGAEGLDGFFDWAPGIALDLPNAKLYWTQGADFIVEPGYASLKRSSLDGSGVETLMNQLLLPGPLALDVAGRKVYWSEFGNPFGGRLPKIQRANLNATGVEDLVPTKAFGIALDAVAGKMYWTLGDSIRRANLDGSGMEDLVTTGLPTGLSGASGIALDIAPAPPETPTVSAWGMMVLVLALLTGIALKFRRSRTT